MYLIALPKSLFGSATTTNEPCPQPQHREDWSAAACSYSSAPSRHSLREASLTAFGKPASGFSETRNLPCCSFTRRLGVLLIRAYPRSSLVLCLQRLGKRLELEIMELLVRHVCVSVYWTCARPNSKQPYIGSAVSRTGTDSRSMRQCLA